MGGAPFPRRPGRLREAAVAHALQSKHDHERSAGEPDHVLAAYRIQVVGTGRKIPQFVRKIDLTPIGE